MTRPAEDQNTLLAAAPDLGLTGPEFLFVYCVLLTGCTLLTFVMRHLTYSAASAGAPEPTPEDYRRLSPSELAYLAGGPRRALLTAVSTLVDRGVIDDDLNVLRGPLASDNLDRLQFGVGQALTRGPATDFEGIRDACAADLDALLADLQSKGLAYTSGTHRAARRWSWPLYVCAGLLIFRFITGAINQHPVGGLFFFAAVTVVLVVFARGRRTRSKPVGRILKKAREDLAHLSPEYRPAYSSYGHFAYPAAVALFGISVMATTRPELTAQPMVTAMGLHGTASGSDTFGGAAGSGCSSCSSGDGGDGGGGGGCSGCGGCGS